jgi:hypothetical protein
MVAYSHGVTKEPTQPWKESTLCWSQKSEMSSTPTMIFTPSLPCAWTMPPLLLRTNNFFTYKKRLHFRSFWTQFPGYTKVV